MKYVKSLEDARREENDLKTNVIMRWLQYQEDFKFNIGDILIKQSKRWHTTNHNDHGDWETETVSKVTGAPRKYMYVFENTLGIGYLRQLYVDGSGFASTLLCIANCDPTYTRFVLDPDYADHLILGGTNEEFTANQMYLEKKKYRDDAIAKNKEMLIKTGSFYSVTAWFNSLKPSDIFWCGETFDAMKKYEVEEVMIKGPTVGQIKGIYRDEHYIKMKREGWSTTQIMTANQFMYCKITTQQPFPLKDGLCGPQK